MPVILCIIVALLATAASALAVTGGTFSATSTGNATKPTAIAISPTTGVVYFTNNGADDIGSATAGANGGSITVGTSTSLSKGDAPFGIAFGPSGNLWAAGASKVWRITPWSGASGTSGTVTTYTITGTGQGIAKGPDGRMWVTVPASNTVLAVATGNAPFGGTAGNVTTYTVPTASSSPYGIAAGSDGRMWVTENAGNKIAAIATGYDASGTSNGTTAGTFTEYTIPTASSSPREAALGWDNNMWFTESAGNKVAKITTSGTITEYSTVSTTTQADNTTLSTAINTPDAITKGPDGNIWFATNQNNTWYSVTTAGTIKVYDTKVTGSSNYSGLAFQGVDGNLWGMNQGQSKIVRLTPAPPSAPTVTLTSPVTSPSNSTSATITFSGDPLATFTCSTDNVTYSACTSPVTLTGLSDGTKNYYVKQTVGSAGTSVASTPVTWTVDATAPAAPTLSGAPSSPTNSTSQNISWSAVSDASGIAHYECSVDGGAYATCTSPQTRSGLAEGSHSLAVRAVDNAGNTGTASTATWTVDTTAPSGPTLTGAPSTYTNSTSQNISWSAVSDASGIARYECSVDGGAYATCTSPQIRSSLATGSHSLAVRAVDNAGNTGTASTATWTVDTAAPAAPTLSGAPSSPTNSTSQNISWSAVSDTSGIARYECSVDGGAYATCTSPQTRSGLAEGSHSLAVRAVDNAGNTGTASTATWTVDTTAPATPTFGVTPPAISVMRNGSLTFSSDSGAAFECSTDGTSYSACTSPYTYNGYDRGSHTLYVRAVDTAGNKSSASSYTWSIIAQMVNSGPNLTDFNSNALSGSIKINYSGAQSSYIKARGWVLNGESESLTVTVNWQRCSTTDVTSCSYINTSPGVSYTGWDYVPRRADVGYFLRSCVTASNGQGDTDLGCSSLSPRVMPVNRDLPSINLEGRSAPKAGVRVATSLGYWLGYNPGSVFLIQWQRCTTDAEASCSDISGATSWFYNVANGDAGNRLRLNVSMTQTVNGADYSVSANSAISAIVESAAALRRTMLSVARTAVRPKPAGKHRGGAKAHSRAKAHKRSKR